MTVKECVKQMCNSTNTSIEELSKTLGLSKSALYNNLNGKDGMSLTTQRLVKYANSMGYTLVLRKEDEEMIIDGKKNITKADEEAFEHIITSANGLTKQGRPLSAEILSKREEREEQGLQLLRECLALKKNIDIPVELHKICGEDKQTYNLLMFKYKDVQERSARGEIALL